MEACAAIWLPSAFASFIMLVGFSAVVAYIVMEKRERV